VGRVLALPKATGKWTWAHSPQVGFLQKSSLFLMFYSSMHFQARRLLHFLGLGAMSVQKMSARTGVQWDA
jgi:hypothetical protein